MTKTRESGTSNIVDLPVSATGGKPLEVARALVDYVKDRPRCNVIAIVQDEEESSITMGWSHMSASEMIMMIEFARYKWRKSTFEAVED